MRLAVNADSLAIWVLPALAEVGGLLYDLTIDDQDHSADWLKRGAVSGAITASPGPIPGCDSTAMGALPYATTCSPGFAARWFGEGVNAETLARAPCLTFDRKDRLQRTWADQAAGRRVALPTHFLPSTGDFVTAARLGLGWGLNPLALAQSALDSGDLVEPIPGHRLSTPLFWQVSRQAAPALRDLTRALMRHAARLLIPPGA